VFFPQQLPIDDFNFSAGFWSGFVCVLSDLDWIFCYWTVTLKLAGGPGATVAVAVDAFGFDSVPSAICAVAAKVCTPAFNVSIALVPVIPVMEVLAALGAAMVNNFTGVAPPVMS
jgi:hypothetical protein